MIAAESAGGGGARFASLASLRSEHTRLLKRHRDEETPQLLDDVEGFLRRAQATGALLDGDEDRWTAQSLLDYWAATLYRAGRRPPDAILDEFDPELAPSLDDALCPYVGLDAFRMDDADRFFGREPVVAECVAKLRESRLLAVIGPSGSGKSSVVLAGVVPALQRGALPGSETWRYFDPIVPGPDPLSTLSRLLAGDRASDEAVVQAEYERLLHDPRRLLTAVSEGATPSPAVFVIDQFEELFTLCNARTCGAFTENLQALIEAPGPRHTVLLTLRSDFETYLARLPGLQSSFERGEIRVTPLSAGQLREAIERPAARVGLKFEDGLVDTLVRDILGEPAALPLLQFTLRKLWDARVRNRITMDAYRRLGGGRMALARSADELYNSLIPEDQVSAPRILLRMVRPGEGLEVTSNPVTREALYRSGEARDRVDRVLEKLIAGYLVRERVLPGVSAGLHLEIAHEALVRNWPTLVAWLDEERVALRRRLRLTAAAEQWWSHGRDPGGLLGGSLLDEALEYDDVNEREREFIQASLAAREAAAREHEERHRRELEAARALAAEQQRRAEIERAVAASLRRRAVILGVVCAIAVAALAVALVSAGIARDRARLAEQERRRAAAASETAIAEAQRADEERVRAEEALANEIELRRLAEELAQTKAVAGTTTVGELQTAIRSFEAQRQETEQLKASLDKWQSELRRARPELTARYARLAAVSALATLRASREENAGATAAAGAPRYTFAIWVDAPPEVLERIARVEYQFNHPTFQQPVMRSTDRNGFRVSYVGWGCLCSVIVTYVPVDSSEGPSTVDFDMCAALGVECGAGLAKGR